MEIIKYKYPLIFWIVLTQSILSCQYINTPIKRNDIYTFCTKGDTINFQLFRKMERILKTDKWYFIWVDLYEEKDFDLYAKHLIVCDRDFVLKGASIAPKAAITHAIGDTLFGWITGERKNDKPSKAYRNDIPNEIKFKISERRSKWNGYQTKAFTIIDSAQFLPASFSIRMYVRTSEGVHFPGRKQYLENSEYYSKTFKKQQVIESSLLSLQFSRNREYVYSIEESDTHNEMHTLDDEILQNLLLDIWQNLNGQ